MTIPERIKMLKQTQELLRRSRLLITAATRDTSSEVRGGISSDSIDDIHFSLDTIIGEFEVNDYMGTSIDK